jgi:hypothetical protein
MVGQTGTGFRRSGCGLPAKRAAGHRRVCSLDGVTYGGGIHNGDPLLAASSSTRISRRDTDSARRQHEVGRETERPLRAADGDDLVLQRLAQGFNSMPNNQTYLFG